MRSREFIDEYYVSKNIHPQTLDSEIDEGNQIKDQLKVLPSGQSPVKELTVRYKDTEYPEVVMYLYDPRTDNCVAVFVSGALDELDNLKYVPTKTGVKIVNPFLMITSEWQQNNIGFRLLSWYLNTHNAVYARENHTLGAKKLWDSLRRADFANVYFDPDTGVGQNAKGKPLSHETAWRFLGRSELFKTESDNTSQSVNQSNLKA